MENLLAALLVRKARFAISCHDAFSCPRTDFAAKIGLVAFAHATLSTESLHCHPQSIQASGVSESAVDDSRFDLHLVCCCNIMESCLIAWNDMISWLYALHTLTNALHHACSFMPQNGGE